MIARALIDIIRRGFALDWKGVHGAPHWARVRDIGLRLARVNQARADVVELFAFIHDSKRQHERHDPEHGLRAAEFARSLRGSHIFLEDDAFEMLTFACVHHSDGLLQADITVQTCWDADRLDLGRVGIRPAAERLCTNAAKDPAMLKWAFLKSRLSLPTSRLSRP